MKSNAFGLPHTEGSRPCRIRQHPRNRSRSDSLTPNSTRSCAYVSRSRCRDALLRILAYELRGRREVGDGELHRIARTIIKDNRLFGPSDLDGRMPRVSKWEW